MLIRFASNGQTPEEQTRQVLAVVPILREQEQSRKQQASSGQAPRAKQPSNSNSQSQQGPSQEQSTTRKHPTDNASASQGSSAQQPYSDSLLGDFGETEQAQPSSGIRSKAAAVSKPSSQQRTLAKAETGTTSGGGGNRTHVGDDLINFDDAVPVTGPMAHLSIHDSSNELASHSRPNSAFGGLQQPLIPQQVIQQRTTPSEGLSKPPQDQQQQQQQQQQGKQLPSHNLVGIDGGDDVSGKVSAEPETPADEKTEVFVDADDGLPH